MLCFTPFPTGRCKPFFLVGWGRCADGYEATWLATCRKEDAPLPPLPLPPLPLPPPSPAPLTDDAGSGEDAGSGS